MASTIAKPTPASEAQLNVDPINAAKKLRVLIRQAREAFAGSGNPDYFNHHYSRALARIGYAKKSQQDAMAGIEELVAAIESRRVTDGRLAVKRLRNRLSYIDMYIKEAEGFFATAKTHVGTGGASPSKKMLDEMHHLIQSLPTVKKAPQTPAEMVLHAIETIMRNGGYGKFKGYMEIKEEVENAQTEQHDKEEVGGDSVN